MEVKDLRLGFGVEFIYENMTDEDKLSSDMRAMYKGCYVEDELVGIISYNDSVKVRRIKALLAKEGFKTDKVYKALIDSVSDDKKELTVYAPQNIYKQFKKNGFEIDKVNRYNIYFMKKGMKKDE